MGIELSFVGVKAGREPHESGGKKSPKQRSGGDRDGMPRYFPPKHFRNLLLGGCPKLFGTLFAGSSFGVVNLLHRVHAPVGLGQETLDIRPIFRTKRHSHAERDDVASAYVAS